MGARESVKGKTAVYRNTQKEKEAYRDVYSKRAREGTPSDYPKKVSGGNEWFSIKASLLVGESFAHICLNERSSISGVGGKRRSMGPHVSRRRSASRCSSMATQAQQTQASGR
jgi:hypothetical protein